MSLVGSYGRGGRLGLQSERRRKCRRRIHLGGSVAPFGSEQKGRPRPNTKSDQAGICFQPSSTLVSTAPCRQNRVRRAPLARRFDCLGKHGQADPPPPQGAYRRPSVRGPTQNGMPGNMRQRTLSQAPVLGMSPRNARRIRSDLRHGDKFRSRSGDPAPSKVLRDGLALISSGMRPQKLRRIGKGAIQFRVAHQKR